MIQLADFCFRRRRFILAGWVLALCAVIFAGIAVPAKHRANYDTPGSDSTRAHALLADRFPAQTGDSIKLVFAGDIRAPAVRSMVEEEIARVAAQRLRDQRTLRRRRSIADFPGRPGGLRRGQPRPRAR